MKNVIYSLYDVKACIYNKPFFEVSDGVAIRNVMSAAEDPNSMLKKHPEDFSLFRLGVYDDSNGTFVLDDRPQLVYALSQSTNVNEIDSNEISNDPPVLESSEH